MIEYVDPARGYERILGSKRPWLDCPTAQSPENRKNG